MINNKKKIILILGLIILGIFLIMFIGTGGKRTDVYLKDYILSDNGDLITLKIGVSGSAGYVRKIKKDDRESHYYSFYSTYGINSKIGAKDSFDVLLDEDDTKIYFNEGKDKYRLVLVKNNVSGNWERIDYSDDGVFKLDLFDRDDIIKISINTGKQDNNYFEFYDKDKIDLVYDILSDLETMVISDSYNPIVFDEMYTILFYNNEDMLLDSNLNSLKAEISLYRNKDKYYVEQRYNGIYEIDKVKFNQIISKLTLK